MSEISKKQLFRICLPVKLADGRMSVKKVVNATVVTATGSFRGKYQNPYLSDRIDLRQTNMTRLRLIFFPKSLWISVIDCFGKIYVVDV